MLIPEFNLSDKRTIDVAAKIHQQQESESVTKRALRRLLSRKMTVFCLGILVFYILITIVGYLGLLPDYQTRYASTYEPPSLEFAKMLGTDIFGRSVLFKVLSGTKTAMTIAIFVTVFTVPLGMILGSIAGYYGGKIDASVAWLYTILSSIPNILLLVGISYAVSTLLGPKAGEAASADTLDFGMISICVALGAVGWIGLCRLIRADVMKHKTMEYVLAVRLLGANQSAKSY
ncbi:MAG: ABC transporter permease, partial [Proteobacteria bacterium]